VCSSKDLIWWLMAVGVTLSSAAARLKLIRRAAASKARRAESGGSLRMITMDELNSLDS
jgi:hypothetical protein